MSTTRSRTFDLGTILSVVTDGRNLSPNGTTGMNEILDYLLGPERKTRSELRGQLRAGRVCILEQYPTLEVAASKRCVAELDDFIAAAQPTDNPVASWLDLLISRGLRAEYRLVPLPKLPK